jgi:putative transposase
LPSASLPSASADGMKIRINTIHLQIKPAKNMSFVKIWVHVVFTTKYREHWLHKGIRNEVHRHIMNNCKKKEIFLQAINGYTDHVYCLISLGKAQSISKLVQLIKGESSFWINQNNLTPGKFSWQDDYYAVSVSESQVKRVVDYIKNQEAHHSKKSLNDEIDELMTKYGLQVISG